MVVLVASKKSVVALHKYNAVILWGAAFMEYSQGFAL
jgi:hypothetical protein